MNVRRFRAHQRFPVDLSVRAHAPGRGTSVDGTMVDLGLGGGACVLEHPLRLGEDVVLVVHAEPAIELRACVAWVGWGEATAARVGFQFVEDDMTLVLALLDRVVPRDDVGT